MFLFVSFFFALQGYAEIVPSSQERLLFDTYIPRFLLNDALLATERLGYIQLPWCKISVESWRVIRAYTLYVLSLPSLNRPDVARAVKLFNDAGLVARSSFHRFLVVILCFWFFLQVV